MSFGSKQLAVVACLLSFAAGLLVGAYAPAILAPKPETTGTALPLKDSDPQSYEYNGVYVDADGNFTVSDDRATELAAAFETQKGFGSAFQDGFILELSENGVKTEWFDCSFVYDIDSVTLNFSEVEGRSLLVMSRGAIINGIVRSPGLFRSASDNYDSNVTSDLSAVDFITDRETAAQLIDIGYPQESWESVILLLTAEDKATGESRDFLVVEPNYASELFGASAVTARDNITPDYYLGNDLFIWTVAATDGSRYLCLRNTSDNVYEWDLTFTGTNAEINGWHMVVHSGELVYQYIGKNVTDLKVLYGASVVYSDAGFGK